MTGAEELHGHDEKMGLRAQQAPVAGENGGKPTTTLREDVAAVGLDKVYERHGRIDLVPLVSSRCRILLLSRFQLTHAILFCSLRMIPMARRLRLHGSLSMD